MHRLFGGRRPPEDAANRSTAAKNDDGDVRGQIGEGARTTTTSSSSNVTKDEIKKSSDNDTRVADVAASNFYAFDDLELPFFPSSSGAKNAAISSSASTTTRAVVVSNTPPPVPNEGVSASRIHDYSTSSGALPGTVKVTSSHPVSSISPQPQQSTSSAVNSAATKMKAVTPTGSAAASSLPSHKRSQPLRSSATSPSRSAAQPAAASAHHMISSPSPSTSSSPPQAGGGGGGGALTTSSAVRTTDNVCVQFLPQEASDADLKLLFSNIGVVRSCRIMVDIETGKSKGYGFVLMNTTAEAVSAVQRLDKLAFKGKKLKVTFADHSPTDRTTKSAAAMAGRHRPTENVESTKHHKEKHVHREHSALRESSQPLSSASRSARRVGGTQQVGEEDVDENMGEHRGGRQLYVKGLPPSWREEQVRGLFTEFGAVQSVRILYQKSSWSKPHDKPENGRGGGILSAATAAVDPSAEGEEQEAFKVSQGIALVRFAKEKSAANALTKLSGTIPTLREMEKGLFAMEPLVVRYSRTADESRRIASDRHRQKEEKSQVKKDPAVMTTSSSLPGEEHNTGSTATAAAKKHFGASEDVESPQPAVTSTASSTATHHHVGVQSSSSDSEEQFRWGGRNRSLMAHDANVFFDTDPYQAAGYGGSLPGSLAYHPQHEAAVSSYTSMGGGGHHTSRVSGGSSFATGPDSYQPHPASSYQDPHLQQHHHHHHLQQHHPQHQGADYHHQAGQDSGAGGLSRRRDSHQGEDPQQQSQHSYNHSPAFHHQQNAHPAATVAASPTGPTSHNPYSYGISTTSYVDYFDAFAFENPAPPPAMLSDGGQGGGGYYGYNTTTSSTGGGGSGTSPPPTKSTHMPLPQQHLAESSSGTEYQHQHRSAPSTPSTASSPGVESSHARRDASWKPSAVGMLFKRHHPYGPPPADDREVTVHPATRHHHHHHHSTSSSSKPAGNRDISSTSSGESSRVPTPSITSDLPLPSRSRPPQYPAADVSGGVPSSSSQSVMVYHPPHPTSANSSNLHPTTSREPSSNSFHSAQNVVAEAHRSGGSSAMGGYDERRTHDEVRGPASSGDGSGSPPPASLPKPLPVAAMPAQNPNDCSGHCCTYCENGTSVLISNMPYERNRCEGTLLTLLNPFGAINYIECLGSGQAIATFAEHRSAVDAVQCMSCTVYSVRILDCVNWFG